MKLNRSNISAGIAAAFAAVVAALLFYKRKAKKAEAVARELQINDVLEKIDKETNAKPLTQLVDDNNKRYNDSPNAVIVKNKSE